MAIPRDGEKDFGCSATLMSQWGHVHQKWRFHLMYKPVGTTVIREHDTFCSLLLSSS